MLSLRLKRTGRTGHAQFRLIAQDRRFSPKSGRVAAYLGSYNPHSKEAELDIEKINAYLKNGAQPSPKVAKLLKKEGVKLPAWVAKPLTKKRAIRHLEKLRRNRPAGEPAPAKEAPAEKPEEPTNEATAKQEAPAEAETTAQEEGTARAETPAAESVTEQAKPEKVAESEEPAEPSTEAGAKEEAEAVDLANDK